MKGVMLHAALGLVGLLLAYQTWTREAEVETPSGEVTLAECTPEKFEAIEIETPVHRVITRKKTGKGGTEYWINSQRKKVEPPPDTKPKSETPAATAKEGTSSTPSASVPAATTAEKPVVPVQKEARPYDPDAAVVFLANAELVPLIKQLTPLRAVRGLGQIPKAQEAAFGFDKLGTRLNLECGGRKTVLDIGGRSFGKGDQYVRDPKTKQAYLLEGQFATDLQSGMYKYMQSALNDFSLADVDEAVIKALGKERHLAHRNRQSEDEARWVDAKEPDKRNELFGNWIDLLDRLKARAYLPAGAEPGADLQIPSTAVAPVLTVEYRLDGKSKGNLEMVRVDSAQGGFYYLRSASTRGWVTTYDSVGKQVEDDLALVMGTVSSPSSAVPASAAASPGSPVSPAPAPRAMPASAHP